MKLRDSFSLSLNNILHRKLRAWLTLLGIIIGVAAVVSIVSIGAGAQSNITESLSGFGADIITINPGFNRAGGFGGGFRGPHGPPSGLNSNNATSSTQEPELEKIDVVIIKGNPNVLYANEIVSGNGELVFLAEQVTASIQGVNPITWTQTTEVELASGRFLGASDSTTVVIGDRLASETFKQPITIGRKITIEGDSFTVVGILTEGSTVYMPFTSAWSVVDVEKDTYSSIKVKVKDTELVEQTTQEITQALMISRKVTERDQDFSVTSSQTTQERISEILGTLTLFLGAIAAVSLIVGAVGIANSMFTSVLEKTKEIGIMKALGSTNGEIMELFLIESGLFGLLGGIIGVLFGIFVSILLSIFVSLNTLVTLELMAMAIFLSTIIGVVSGLIPARSASKLNPIEALRYE